MNCDEFINLNKILTEEVGNKGHSFSMVINNHKSDISKCKRTLYNYVEKGYIDINNIDLPRKVRYKKRTKKQEVNIRNTKIREGRTYKDFLKYKEDFFVKNGFDANIVQMDTVVGPYKSNESCILTLLFTTSNFLMVFKLESKTMEAVNNMFDYLKDTLGLELFSNLFQVILTDNGSEFFDPDYIEYNGLYEKSRIFYCDPRQSQQKGKIEVAHEYIRRYIPKGTSFNPYSQEQLTLMCNHINSVPRDKFKGLSAFKVQQVIVPDEFFKKLNYKEIYKLDVNLKANLLRKDTTK